MGGRRGARDEVVMMTTAAMVYEEFPRLETDRLVLRELTSADAHDLFQIFSNSEITRYYDLDTFTRMQ